MGKGTRNRKARRDEDSFPNDPNVRSLTSEEIDDLVSGKTSYREELHPMGGSMWRVEDRGLSAQDGGEALVAAFIEEHPHDDFTLSIYDTITQSTVEILCPLSEMPRIVAFVYHLEKATPLEFIGENLLSDSYVVGMPLTRGRISVGTLYRAEDGKLAPLVV